MPRWLTALLGIRTERMIRHNGQTWVPDEDRKDLQNARLEQRLARASANAAADAVRERMTFLEKALTPYRRSNGDYGQGDGPKP